MKSNLRHLIFSALCCALFVPCLRAAEPRNLKEALLNYTWEWTHAPKPPDMLVFQKDGVAACARFAWHWKITGDRTALGYDVIDNGSGKVSPGFKAKLTFDPTFTTLDGMTDNGKYHYTGRRLTVSAGEAQALSRAITSSRWTWVLLQPNQDPWDERQFAPDGTATAWRRGVMTCTGRWEVAGPRTVRIQNITQRNVHLLTFDPSFSTFEGVDNTGANHYRGVVLGPALPSAQPSPATQTDSNQPRIETLSQQALNAEDWVVAPLDESVPGGIRQNLVGLREDLADEGKKKPKVSIEAYSLGYQLCNTMVAALDERARALVNAGYTARQADANTGVTSPALEANRNYMMSWPQYRREQAQRGEMLRQKLNGAGVIKEGSKVEWSRRATQIRGNIDALYGKLREAMRQVPAK